MGKDLVPADRTDIADAEFVDVKPPFSWSRLLWGPTLKDQGWTDDEIARWKQLPLRKRYRYEINWWVVAMAFASSLPALIRAFKGP